jgi:GTPase SAR1 family protein
MPRFIQLVIGPAGVGKTSYCKTMQDHGKASKRTIHVANLDPAAEYYQYDAEFDIRDLISLEEVMEEYGYGPNGGLVYCMEYLFQNSDWLKEELENFSDDEYIILDCPGQIELYSHLPIMHNLASLLKSWDFNVVSVYLMDAMFVLEPSKFISGCMLSLSCMLQLELPHVNVITKCDIADKEQIERVLDTEGTSMISMLESRATPAKLKQLTRAIGSVVDDYMIVSFTMLDVSNEDSIELVLAHIDNAMQYGEDLDVKEPKDMGDERDGDDGYGGNED